MRRRRALPVASGTASASPKPCHQRRCGNAVGAGLPTDPGPTVAIWTVPAHYDWLGGQACRTAALPRLSVKTAVAIPTLKPRWLPDEPKPDERAPAWLVDGDVVERAQDPGSVVRRAELARRDAVFGVEHRLARAEVQQEDGALRALVALLVSTRSKYRSGALAWWARSSARRPGPVSVPPGATHSTAGEPALSGDVEPGVSFS